MTFDPSNPSFVTEARKLAGLDPRSHPFNPTVQAGPGAPTAPNGYLAESPLQAPLAQPLQEEGAGGDEDDALFEGISQEDLLGEPLLEAVNSEKLGKDLQSLIDKNEHTKAKALAALRLGNRKLADAFANVEKIADFLGHMPHGLMDVRYELERRLRYMAKKKLDQEAFRKLSHLI